MDIKKYFDYYSTVIPIEKVMELSENDLDDLYANSEEVDRMNVFFHLFNEYIYLKQQDAKKETAHICYLISYYVFHPLTPPHSENIALEYAKKAIQYDNDIKYNDWIKEVMRGN
ncbi:hypothetical protein CLTEP_14680 [Clostridium tepidiprofundi DSM 19306]|uniref:Uncharacterized protein n=1 Tax=Clostridium tepidiprofundi DSM 19306 TaxID=1121338 RepID=A0A151B421_9CLOT|nr:hypothetical protein [Clostridium tepidiprofundi]KYH34540.1 hypothetical protein CLTEP_14680 [Clostridium tepidiprofundi DSM 19306]